jgi:hypothetical protein
VGFRFDFNYFLIRFDIGFRFKRPDIIENYGWQFPDITLKNLFGNSLKNRMWRYENFNATIGIDYPFVAEGQYLERNRSFNRWSKKIYF